MYKSSLWLLINICILVATSSYAGVSRNADDRFFYIGAGFGMGEPAKKQFKHNSSMVIRLKNSHMYNIRAGYSFYPQMAIEFSATFQPKGRIAYILPETVIPNGLIIPKTPGKTRLTANMYTLNLVYDLEEFKFFTPSGMFGAGIAQAKVHSASSRNDGFRIKKTLTNYFIWQLGGGLSVAITNDLKIGAAAKLHVFPKTKIKYDQLDTNTGSYITPPPIKKAIGVAEFSLGFTYKIPV